MSETLSIPLLVGTEREGRLSIHVARWLHGLVTARPHLRSPFIDPRDLPWLGNLRHREWEFPEPPPGLPHLTAALAEADGFLIVTPEYNHGYPGALKNLLDTWYDEWNGKPFGIVTVSNGSFGGLRAAEQLRVVIGGIGALTIPTSMPVPKVSEAFDEEGRLQDPAYERRAGRLLDELERYARALRIARAELEEKKG